MTTALYDAIRQDLDSPRHKMVQPCAPATAPVWRIVRESQLEGDLRPPVVRADDGMMKIDERGALDQLLPRTQVRCALLATSMALPVWEAGNPGDQRPRDVARLVARFLCGDGAVTERMMHEAGESLMRYPYYCRVESPEQAAAGAAAGLAFAGRWAATHPHDDRSDPREEGKTQRISLQTSFVLHCAREASGRHLEFVLDWWDRCRALLPISDVATAQIQWEITEF